MGCECTHVNCIKHRHCYSSDNKSSDNKSSDNKSSDNKSSDNKSSDNKSSDNKSSDNKSSDNKSSDNKSSDNKSSDNKSSDNKSSHNKSSDNKSSASVQVNYRKTTRVVRPCDDDKSGGRIGKNARCGQAREKKKRAAKPKGPFKCFVRFFLNIRHPTRRNANNIELYIFATGSFREI